MHTSRTTTRRAIWHRWCLCSLMCARVHWFRSGASCGWATSSTTRTTRQAALTLSCLSTDERIVLLLSIIVRVWHACIHSVRLSYFFICREVCTALSTVHTGSFSPCILCMFGYSAVKFHRVFVALIVHCHEKWAGDCSCFFFHNIVLVEYIEQWESYV